MYLSKFTQAMTDSNKMMSDFHSVVTKYILPLGVSTAAVGVLLFLKKFGILYQLFHKVYLETLFVFFLEWYFPTHHFLMNNLTFDFPGLCKTMNQLLQSADSLFTDIQQIQ